MVNGPVAVLIFGSVTTILVSVSPVPALKCLLLSVMTNRGLLPQSDPPLGPLSVMTGSRSTVPLGQERTLSSDTTGT
jgi:hypothetical protein